MPSLREAIVPSICFITLILLIYSVGYGVLVVCKINDIGNAVGQQVRSSTNITGSVNVNINLQSNLGDGPVVLLLEGSNDEMTVESGITNIVVDFIMDLRLSFSYEYVSITTKDYGLTVELRYDKITSDIDTLANLLSDGNVPNILLRAIRAKDNIVEDSIPAYGLLVSTVLILTLFGVLYSLNVYKTVIAGGSIFVTLVLSAAVLGVLVHLFNYIVDLMQEVNNAADMDFVTCELGPSTNAVISIVVLMGVMMLFLIIMRRRSGTWIFEAVKS